MKYNIKKSIILNDFIQVQIRVKTHNKNEDILHFVK